MRSCSFTPYTGFVQSDLMKARLALALVLVGLVVVPGLASAQNSLTDYLGPQEISMGEAMRADARGATSITLNPAGLSLNQQLVFAGSYGFRPTDHASLVSAAACDSTVAIPGCFHYNYFTAEPEIAGNSMNRSAHQFGISASRALTQNILLGVNSKYFRYKSDLPMEENVNGFAFDFGLILRLGSVISLGGVGYNLLTTEDTPQYPRAVGGGVALKPVDALSLVFDARWNLDTEIEEMKGPRFGGGAEYFFSSKDRQSGFPIRAGVLRDDGTEVTYMTAGTGYVTTRVGIDLGVRREMSGEKETVIQAGLRLFGPGI